MLQVWLQDTRLIQNSFIGQLSSGLLGISMPSKNMVCFIMLMILNLSYWDILMLVMRLILMRGNNAWILFILWTLLLFLREIIGKVQQ